MTIAYKRELKIKLEKAMMFSIATTLVSGAMWGLQPANDNSGLIADLIPAVESVQNDLGLVKTKVEAIEARTNSLTSNMNDISKNLTALSKSGGIISNPETIEDYYVNGLLYIERGNYKYAQSSIVKALSINANLIDLHKQFQILLRLQMGDKEAKKIYTDLLLGDGGVATQLMLSQLLAGGDRINQIKLVIESSQDYAPAHYFYAEEMQKNVEDAYRSNASLQKEIGHREAVEKISESGKWHIHFLNRLKADELLGDNRKKLNHLRRHLKARPTADLEWNVEVDRDSGRLTGKVYIKPLFKAPEQVQEIFFTIDGNAEKSSGFTKTKNPITNKPFAKARFEQFLLKNPVKEIVISVSYLDVNGNKVGPILFSKSPLEILEINANEEINRYLSTRTTDKPSSLIYTISGYSPFSCFLEKITITDQDGKILKAINYEDQSCEAETIIQKVKEFQFGEEGLTFPLRPTDVSPMKLNGQIIFKNGSKEERKFTVRFKKYDLFYSGAKGRNADLKQFSKKITRFLNSKEPEPKQVLEKTGRAVAAKKMIQKIHRLCGGEQIAALCKDFSISEDTLQRLIEICRKHSTSCGPKPVKKTKKLTDQSTPNSSKKWSYKNIINADGEMKKKTLSQKFDFNNASNDVLECLLKEYRVINKVSDYEAKQAVKLMPVIFQVDLDEFYYSPNLPSSKLIRELSAHQKVLKKVWRTSPTDQNYDSLTVQEQITNEICANDKQCVRFLNFYRVDPTKAEKNNLARATLSGFGARVQFTYMCNKNEEDILKLVKNR